jgi:hypothetical protein
MCDAVTGTRIMMDSIPENSIPPRHLSFASDIQRYANNVYIINTVIIRVPVLSEHTPLLRKREVQEKIHTHTYIYIYKFIPNLTQQNLLPLQLERDS